MSSIKYLTTKGNFDALDDLMIYELEEHFKENVIFPHSDEYEEECAIWNGEINRTPACIVKCQTTEDIQSAVLFATDYNVKISIRSTGHHVAGSSLIDHGMVLDLSDMNDIEVYPDNQTATAQAGVTWGELDSATQKYGLATPGGVVSDTGISGLTLGGGYGWLRRDHGLASDNVISMEVVTGTGEVITVDAENHSDLYWALRGGSGNFGVVTEFTYKLHPVGPDLYMAVKFYKADTDEKAVNVLENYIDITNQLDNKITSMALIGWVPDEEFIPEEHRNKRTVIILGVYNGDPKEGKEQLTPLGELGSVRVDLSDTMSYNTIQTFFDEDYPDGMRYYWTSLYFDQMKRSILENIVLESYKSPSKLTTVDIWHLGGKISENVNKGAIPFRNAEYLLGIESNWVDQAASEDNIEWNRTFRNKIKSFALSGGYVNFSSGEGGKQSTKEHYHQLQNRLFEIKDQYDPKGLIHTQISVGAE